VLHTGRYIQQWIGDERWEIPLSALPPDCATVLGEAAANAISNSRPYLASAHCVRDGTVRTYDVLALPTASRFGGTLVGVYVNERAANTIFWMRSFSTTEEGVLSLATIRDASGRPADFQIVHHNEDDGTAKLLRVPSAGLQWRRRISVVRAQRPRPLAQRRCARTARSVRARRRRS